MRVEERSHCGQTVSGTCRLAIVHDASNIERNVEVADLRWRTHVEAIDSVVANIFPINSNRQVAVVSVVHVMEPNGAGLTF